MKTNKITLVAVIAVAILLVSETSTFAQRGRGLERMGGQQELFQNIPRLTPEQTTQINELRVPHLTQMQAFRDKVDVNRAQYRAAMRSANADMNAVNRLIDEHTALTNQMEKARASHLQAVRGLLTDEQKLIFDGVAGVRPNLPGVNQARRVAPPAQNNLRGAGNRRF